MKRCAQTVSAADALAPSGPKPSKRAKTAPSAPIVAAPAPAPVVYSMTDFVMVCNDVLDGKTGAHSFSALHNGVYHAVMNGSGAAIYDAMLEIVRAKCVDARASLSGSPPSAATVLCAATKLCRDFFARVRMICGATSMLERAYVQKKGKEPVATAAARAYLEIVLLGSGELRRLNEAFFATLAEYRRGESGRVAEMRGYVDTLRELFRRTDYPDSDRYFRAPLLDATRAQCEQESIAALQRFSVPEYVAWAAERLSREASAHELIFLEAAPAPAKADAASPTALKALVTDHAASLVRNESTGLAQLMKNERFADVGRMHDLFTRTGNDEATRALMMGAYDAYLRETLRETLEGKDGMADLVRVVRKMDGGAFEACFGKSPEAGKILRAAFESALSEGGRYKSSMRLCELFGAIVYGEEHAEDREGALGAAMRLFCFLRNKSVFEMFYRTDLFRRLVTRKELDRALEESVIAKLRLQCGPGFTHKIEAMYDDALTNSTKLVDAFFAGRQQRGPVEHLIMSRNACTPLVRFSQADSKSVRLPPLLQTSIAEFEEFFSSRYSGRRELSWNLALGSCVLDWDGRELVVSALQYAVLPAAAAAAADARLSFAELMRATGIVREDLEEHLSALVSPKHPVLTKTGDAETFADGDAFEVNARFSSERARVVLCGPNGIRPKAKRAAEGAAVVEEIDAATRRSQTEAFLVRTMKTNTRLRREELMERCSKILLFEVTPLELSSRLSSLVEREYIEVDAADPDTYVYVP